MDSHRPQPAFSSTPVPARAGIGLKPQHFDTVLASRPDIGWFEVHAENYLVDGGPLHHCLERIRADYPLSFHCVGMSPGSTGGIDAAHVRRVAALCQRYQPALVSDHLSWSRWAHGYLNDLLPLPCTAETLQQCCDNVDHIQEILGRTIAIENPSLYLALPGAEMDECDFLLALARRTGAGILLDVNNLYVSACNLGWQPLDYLRRIPAAVVKEIHLAGHLVEHTEAGVFRVDNHGSRVCSEVWELYRHALHLLGPLPSLIEWDTDVPAFAVLQQEAAMADACLAQAALREMSYGPTHAVVTAPRGSLAP